MRHPDKFPAHGEIGRLIYQGYTLGYMNIAIVQGILTYSMQDGLGTGFPFIFRKGEHDLR